MDKHAKSGRPWLPRGAAQSSQLSLHSVLSLLSPASNVFLLSLAISSPSCSLPLLLAAACWDSERVKRVYWYQAGQ